MPSKRTKQDDIDHLKRATKNIADKGYLTEKYGIREEEAMPQNGATDPLEKKETPTK